MFQRLPSIPFFYFMQVFIELYFIIKLSIFYIQLTALVSCQWDERWDLLRSMGHSAVRLLVEIELLWKKVCYPRLEEANCARF